MLILADYSQASDSNVQLKHVINQELPCNLLHFPDI